MREKQNKKKHHLPRTLALLALLTCDEREGGIAEANSEWEEEAEDSALSQELGSGVESQVLLGSGSVNRAFVVEEKADSVDEGKLWLLMERDAKEEPQSAPPFAPLVDELLHESRFSEDEEGGANKEDEKVECPGSKFGICKQKAKTM